MSYKKLVTHVQSNVSVVNLLESREQRYIKKQSRRNKIHPEGYKFYSILFCFLHG